MSLEEPRPKPRPWFALWRAEGGSFAQLPLIARALFSEILKLTDDEGVIDLGGKEPTDAIAFALGADRNDRRALSKYVPMLLADGCLCREGDHLIAPSFERWQPKTKAPRKPPRLPRTNHEPTTNEPLADHLPTTCEPLVDHASIAKSAETAEPLPDVVEYSRVEKSRDIYNPPNPPASQGDVGVVFEYWRAAFGKRPTAKLDARRRRKIEAALKSYGLEAVKRCIDGYARSPHHRGQNDTGTVYDDVELFLRDASHIEAGIEKAQRLASSDPARKHQHREWAAELERLQVRIYKLDGEHKTEEADRVRAERARVEAAGPGRWEAPARGANGSGDARNVDAHIKSALSGAFQNLRGGPRANQG